MRSLHLLHYTPTLLQYVCTIVHRTYTAACGGIKSKNKLSVISTRHRLTNIWLAQPLPACSVRRTAVVQVVQHADERKEVGWVKCLEDEGGCCSFYHWYSIYILYIKSKILTLAAGSHLDGGHHSEICTVSYNLILFFKATQILTREEERQPPSNQQSQESRHFSYFTVAWPEIFFLTN